MKNWMLSISSKIRASYWFLPLVMAILAMLLAISITNFDNWLGQQWFHPNIFPVNQPAAARAILATIAGSMITVAGVTFSMTIVVVSFALGQIGPRLIHNFMRDKVNQFTLGTFIATFLYCLLILRSILDPGNNSSAFVPHIAIFISILLAVFNVGVLIFFIHHIQESINISTLLARIGNDLLLQIKKLYPTDPDYKPEFNDFDQKQKPHQFEQKPYSIYPNKDGYIRFLDIDKLIEIATKNDCIIEVIYRPGEFVSKATPILYISKPLEQDIGNNCITCFVIGSERDQEQDILFLSDEIVEIIARALSPSMNDPFTAITAINWLECAIESLLRQKMPDSYHYDNENKLRVISYPVTCYHFINRVLGQILPYVTHDRNTALYILNVLKKMLENTPNKSFYHLLLLHVDDFHQATEKNLVSIQDKKTISLLVTEIKNLTNKK